MDGVFWKTISVSTIEPLPPFPRIHRRNTTHLRPLQRPSRPNPGGLLTCRLQDWCAETGDCFYAYEDYDSDLWVLRVRVREGRGREGRWRKSGKWIWRKGRVVCFHLLLLLIFLLLLGWVLFTIYWWVRKLTCVYLHRRKRQQQHRANNDISSSFLQGKYHPRDSPLIYSPSPTHLLGGAGIHTLSITAGGRCQPVMVMVPYFTTNQVVFYPSEPPD